MTEFTQQVDELETASASASSTRNVLVSGATGLVGRALVERLSSRGDAVTRLVRSAPSGTDIVWDPSGGGIGETEDTPIDADAVVHLAGENIADGRWTRAKMDAIRTSRVRGTRLLAERLAGLERPPKVLVSASAIGFYGDRGDEALTERSCAGSGFLAEVCQEWERATEPASAAGIRVVCLRIGVVLSKDGGALSKMLVPFKLGLGGRTGHGRQAMSWILLDDLVSIICRAIDDERLEGPVNATAPAPVSNREFALTLARVLGRPAIATMPGFVARAAFGRLANDLLLASLRVFPERLRDVGFEFAEPQLEGALRSALGLER